MELNKLFLNREHLKSIPEQRFERLTIDIGLLNPIIFISNKQMSLRASHFNLQTVDEQNFDLSIISADSCVLMYVINVKAPYMHYVKNGIIIRNRAKWSEKDLEDINVRYTFDNDFQVLTNGNQSATIFCKNLTSEQKT